MSHRDDAAPPGDFSLVLGGPLYQLFLKTRLARPPLDLLHRRVLALTGLAWLPLLVLSALDGRLLAGAGIPFLKDVDVQVRFLVALPLLVFAERIVHDRLLPSVRLLVGQGVVRPEDRARLDAIVASMLRWRNSFVVEIALLVFCFTAGHVLWAERLAGHGDIWYLAPGGTASELSRAGLWYAWFSLPLFQFILMRWWYRLILWARFLWSVSRLDLVLLPAHPDRAGGLGFLGTGTAAFAPLLVAQSSLMASLVAGRILYQGAKLDAFKVELGGILVFAVLQVLAPLLVFSPALVRAKRRGLREFGALGSRYAREFERKWILGGAPPEEPFVGSADIQSLADLDGSFDIVRGMRPVPFGKDSLIQLFVAIATPGLPLLLTVMPLEELVKKVLGAIF